MSRRSAFISNKQITTLIIGLIWLFIIWIGNNQGWFDKPAKSFQQNNPGLYSVSKFVDGDTIEVNMNGHNEKVRLIGVDTPETHKPNTPVQCYGPAAAAFTKRSLENKQFRLVSDELTTDRDKYGRLLRYIYLQDNINFNQTIISNGYGFYYPYFPFTKKTDFASAQDKAKLNNLGLWGNCSPTPTDKGGWVSNPAQ